MPPKRQHVIPVLHLKHFVGDAPRGQVWTYDAETGAVRSATPENTAVQTHFYSVERDDGTLDTHVEEVLGQIEGAAAPVYEALLGGVIPKDPVQRAAFASFLASMYVRTPAARRMAGEMYGRYIQIMNYAFGCSDEAFDSLIRRYEKDSGRTLDATERKRLREGLLDPSRFIVQVPKERTFAAFGAAEKLAPLLFNMTWTLATARHGYFVTSDHPLVRLVDPRTNHPIYGDHGFVNKTAEVTFPLSPKKLLIMTWKRYAPEHAVLKRLGIDTINAARAAHSDRYLYAHLRDKRLQKLAEKYRDSRPGWTTKGFGPKKFAKVTVPRHFGGSGQQHT